MKWRNNKTELLSLIRDAFEREVEKPISDPYAAVVWLQQHHRQKIETLGREAVWEFVHQEMMRLAKSFDEVTPDGAWAQMGLDELYPDCGFPKKLPVKISIPHPENPKTCRYARPDWLTDAQMDEWRVRMALQVEGYTTKMTAIVDFQAFRRSQSCPPEMTWAEFWKRRRGKK